MKNETPILEINDLKVVYQTDLETVEAVNNISLSIGRGKTLGLVGETGAGKTTTALSILRLLPATTGRIQSGSITFDGQDLLAFDEHFMQAIRGNRISMVFQDPMTSLNPVMTVGDQIAEVIAVHNPDLGKEELRERVIAILAKVGISSDRIDEYPHQFSGGMKQRVIIAIALACNPKLLLADEPTTALDVTIQAQVLDMIQTLKKELNTAMILISHDLGVVAQTCDRVAIIYAGRIVEEGDLRDIFKNPRHPYTIGLLESIPSLTKETKRLNPIKGLMPDPTNLPPGCPFAPRCNYACEECSKAVPELEEVNLGHLVRCIRIDSVEEVR